jgi:hypothetical protein
MMNDMGIGITGYRFDQQSNEFYLQRTLHDTLYELPFSSTTIRVFRSVREIKI